MSPRNDNKEPEAMPKESVSIPHDANLPTPAPISAPPLPTIEPLPVRPINIVDNAPIPPFSTPVLPIVPPVTLHEFHEHDGRRWPVFLMYTLLALLVAVMVVFAGRWVYRKANNNPVKTTPDTSTGVSLPAAPTTNTPTNKPASGASSTQTVLVTLLPSLSAQP
jgi:hypothetical protein